MATVAETGAVIGSGMGQGVVEVAETTVHKVRVSRRDRRMVRAALTIMGVLAALDVVLYLGRII